MLQLAVRDFQKNEAGNWDDRWKGSDVIIRDPAGQRQPIPLGLFYAPRVESRRSRDKVQTSLMEGSTGYGFAVRSNPSHRQRPNLRRTMAFGKRGIPTVKMISVSLAAVALACAQLLLGQAEGRPPANIAVTITPTKVTLYAGETQTFAATVVGVDDKTVNWSVDEEDGGVITNLALYTAPKIQGVYHVIATSRLEPRAKSVATVTVLTYCDPGPPSLRP